MKICQRPKVLIQNGQMDQHIPSEPYRRPSTAGTFMAFHIYTLQSFPFPHIPDDETTVYLYDNQLNCNCEMHEIHNFFNNELSTQFQSEGNFVNFIPF